MNQNKKISKLSIIIMSYYFDNNSRYQIIYPYTSDKIYVESSIDHGAYRCYQELKDRDVITYIYIVHDIDKGTLYYFNIPKNKHLDATQNQATNPLNPAQNQATNPLNPTQNQATNPLNPTQNQATNSLNPISHNTIIQDSLTQLPSMQSINIINPDHSAIKQNEIITRLNHVEYQLDVLKKRIQSAPKKEEDGCVIM